MKPITTYLRFDWAILTLGPATFWAITAADKLPGIGRDRLAQFMEQFPPTMSYTLLIVVSAWQIALAVMFARSFFRGPRDSAAFGRAVTASVALFFFFLIGDRITDNQMVVKHALWALGWLFFGLVGTRLMRR